METLPLSDPENSQPSKEVMPYSVVHPEFTEAETNRETTKIAQETWDQAYAWVVGDPTAGTKGIPHVGPLGLSRKLNVDERTATAIFEEMQDRGIITRLSIPTPGKGAARTNTYDQSQFGGYMVLINPDGSSKQPHAPAPLPKGPEFTPAPQLRKDGLGKLLGSKALGRGVVGVSQSLTDFANLKIHHAKDSKDYLSRSRSARHHDATEHKVDRLYDEIFNPQLGLMENWVDDNGVTRQRVAITSWMKREKTRAWKRTVPALEIVEDLDTRSQAEREVDAEIETLRARGLSDAEIKTNLAKTYHPDRTDGGDPEKAGIVTMKFMEARERLAEAPLPPKPDIDQIIEEGKAAERQAAEADGPTPEESASSELSDEETYVIGIAYLANGTGKKGTGFKRMSPESFRDALTAKGVSEQSANDLYAELQEKGFISKTYKKGEGYRVLKNIDEFKAILKDIS